jgi:hypothetical protein
MSTAESPRKRMRNEDPDANGHGAKAISSEVLRLGRDLPRTIRRELDVRPGVVLAAVAGGSFVVGAVLGSRIGRIALAALLPVGVQYLLRTQLGPALWERVVSLAEKTAKGGAGGRTATE